MEVCIGCNRQQKTSTTMVAVVKNARGDGFVAKPVCDNCWQDPGHRTTTIKGTFFQRSQAPVALAAAGSSTIRA